MAVFQNTQTVHFNSHLPSFALSVVKISFYLRGGILPQWYKIVIFSGSCTTLLLILLEMEWALRWMYVMAALQKNPNCTFQVSNLPGLARSGVKISFYLSGVILTQWSKLTFSVAHVPPYYSFLFDLQWTLGWILVMAVFQKKIKL